MGMANTSLSLKRKRVEELKAELKELNEQIELEDAFETKILHLTQCIIDLHQIEKLRTSGLNERGEFSAARLPVFNLLEAAGQSSSADHSV